MEDNEQQQLIFSGRNVEEALKIAREKLDLDPYAELNYEVLGSGKKKKFLFFGGTKETHEVRILIKFGQGSGTGKSHPDADAAGNSIKNMVEGVWQDQTASGVYPRSRQGYDRQGQGQGQGQGQDSGRRDRRPHRGSGGGRPGRDHRRDRGGSRFGSGHSGSGGGDRFDRRGSYTNRRPQSDQPRAPAPPVQPEVLSSVGVELNALFQKMGFDIKVVVESSLKNPSIIRVSSEGQDSGWLLGYPDMNPNSVEELMTKMVKAKFGEDKSCRLYFVGRREGGRRGYSESPRVDEAALKEQVVACLDRIKQTGEAEFLGPMNAYERRVVHTLVAEQGNYVTESVGDGPRKKVKITHQP